MGVVAFGVLFAALTAIAILGSHQKLADITRKLLPGKSALISKKGSQSEKNETDHATRAQFMRNLVKDGYNNSDYAEKFRTDSTPRPFERQLFDRFFSLLPSQPTILDLGCGPGLPYDRYMVDKGARLRGVDVSGKHVRLARRNVPEAEFVEADFSKWTTSQAFDGITCMYAFFHIPREEHGAFFEHITQMIADGGAIMTTLTHQEVGGASHLWMGTPMEWSTYAPEYYLQLFNRLGFSIVHVADQREENPSEKHLWVIAQRQKGLQTDSVSSSVNAWGTAIE